jgi:hypothetical protein
MQQTKKYALASLLQGTLLGLLDVICHCHPTLICPECDVAHSENLTEWGNLWP